MTDTSTARAIGTALIVSEDTVATRQIAEAMRNWRYPSRFASKSRMRWTV